MEGILNLLNYSHLFLSGQEFKAQGATKGHVSDQPSCAASGGLRPQMQCVCPPRRERPLALNFFFSHVASLIISSVVIKLLIFPLHFL